MKLIQALSELKLIRKKIDQNNALIQEYASACSMNLKLDDERAQKDYLDSLLQSSHDLLQRLLLLRLAVDRTNLQTTVETEYGAYPLAALLALRGEKTKPGLAALYRNIYEHLNDNVGQRETQLALQSLKDVTNPPVLRRFYDPKARNQTITYWTEFRERIDAMIEVTNAETDLIE